LEVVGLLAAVQGERQAAALALPSQQLDLGPEGAAATAHRGDLGCLRVVVGDEHGGMAGRAAPRRLAHVDERELDPYIARPLQLRRLQEAWRQAPDVAARNDL